MRLVSLRGKLTAYEEIGDSIVVGSIFDGSVPWINPIQSIWSFQNAPRFKPRRNRQITRDRPADHSGPFEFVLVRSTAIEERCSGIRIRRAVGIDEAVAVRLN
jgi:hypothetical protein